MVTKALGEDSEEREWFLLKVTFIYLVGVLCAGVAVRGQPARVCLSIQLVGRRRSDSGHQTWQQVPVPAEPSSSIPGPDVSVLSLVVETA